MNVLALYLAAEMHRYFPDAVHTRIDFVDETTRIVIIMPVSRVITLTSEAGSDDDWYTFTSPDDDSLVITVPFMKED